MWRALKQVTEAKDAAVRGLFFEEASLLRDREREVKQSLAAVGVRVDEMVAAGGLPGSAIVDVADIEAIAAAWSGKLKT